MTRKDAVIIGRKDSGELQAARSLLTVNDSNPLFLDSSDS